jgi:coenzyme F420 hydrogenase subunit beta
VATTEEEVESAAGSKYTASPALSIMATALERFSRLAFVGVPCQITALRNMQQTKDKRYDALRVKILIGLFCAESFTYGVTNSHGIAAFVEKELGLPLTAVTRFDIKKNNLLVYGPDRVESRPLAEVKDYAWPLCYSCRDLTAELADISVGAVGSKADENALLARSKLGLEIVEQAREAGILQLADLRNPGLIERIAKNKHDRRAAVTPDEERFLFKRSIRGNFKKNQQPQALST